MSEPTRLFDFPHYQLKNNPLDNMFTSKLHGEWITYSTQQFMDMVKAASRGLIELGVKEGDRVALISHNNRVEWNVMDHAIMQIGAIDVPIYPTMTEEDYDYILNHSESILCFVSNEELLTKVQNIKSKVPSLRDVYTFENVAGAKNWAEVREMGKPDTHQAEVEKRMAVVKPLDLATIIYTSGTTGKPKGVMLSHENITHNAMASSERLPQGETTGAKVLSFLPVCHIYERMLHYLYMYNGASIYFAEALETIKDDLFMVKPYMFSAVPRLLEKFHDGIVNKGAEAKGIKLKIFQWAVNLAYQWEPEGKNGGFYEWKLGIARKLVFSKVQEALGLTGIKAIASGSAALSPKLVRFFNGAGLATYEGYGLTETSPVLTVNTMNSKGMLAVGSVGKALRDVQIKIASDGEILAKGPNVMMGYYNDPEKTDEVLKDGWFHTGDIGEVTGGFLRITDRKKEMFKTSGGKYVAPQLVENALKESYFIEQAMVIGEGQKHPAALVYPQFEGIKKYCLLHDKTYPGDAEVLKEEWFIERLWQDIDEKNLAFGKWEQVKKLRFLPEPMTVENGQLTPKLSMKRKVLRSTYQHLIDDIFADGTKQTS